MRKHDFTCLAFLSSIVSSASILTGDREGAKAKAVGKAKSEAQAMADAAEGAGLLEPCESDAWGAPPDNPVELEPHPGAGGGDDRETAPPVLPETLEQEEFEEKAALSSFETTTGKSMTRAERRALARQG